MENQIRLRWTSHQGTILSVFDALLSSESLVDVTLACEGQYLRAHKVILSACSPYFQELINVDLNIHPIFFLKDVKFNEIKALIQYMYRGEVNISHEDLPSLLAVAQALKIRGLAEVEMSSNNISSDTIILPDLGNKKTSHKLQSSPFVPEPPKPSPMSISVSSQNVKTNRGMTSATMADQPVAKKPRVEPRRSSRTQISKQSQIMDPLADEQSPPDPSPQLADPLGNIPELPFAEGDFGSPGTAEDSGVYDTEKVKVEDVAGVVHGVNNEKENSASQLGFPDGWHWDDDEETSDQDDDIGEIPGGSGATNSGEDSPFPCPNPDCYKVYRCKGNLSRHLRFECKVVPHQFGCICGTKTKRKDSLFRHQKKCDVFQTNVQQANSDNDLL